MHPMFKYYNSVNLEILDELYFSIQFHDSEHDSASAAIRRRLKTSRQIYKQILALKEFSQSIFVQKKPLKFVLFFHCLL